MGLLDWVKDFITGEDKAKSPSKDTPKTFSFKLEDGPRESQSRFQYDGSLASIDKQRTNFAAGVNNVVDENSGKKEQELPFRGRILNVPANATRDELKELLQATVETGADSVDAVHDRFEKIRGAIGEKEKYAAEPGTDTENKFRKYINNFDLPADGKQKLLEMITVKNYERAVQAASELDPGCRIPPMAQITAEIKKYDSDKLKDICEMIEKPKLVIVPNNSFNDKVGALNMNKHYVWSPSSDTYKLYLWLAGKPHKDVCMAFNTEIGWPSPYNNVPKASKSKVIITDATPHPKQLKKLSEKLAETLMYLSSLYTPKGMRNIGGDEFAVLMQQSLIESAEINDSGCIIDYNDHITKSGRKNKPWTYTLLDPGSLTPMDLQPLAEFDTDPMGIGFRARQSMGKGWVRGRPTLTVMEF